MSWKRFNLVNNILGWATFLIAATVYLMTIGPTASLWDCAEFIACVNKLEVGHPPGAPFFMLVYNVITNLTGDPTKVAFLANATSALLSALTILFLFWTIGHMVRRIITPDVRPYDLEPVRTELTLTESILIWGSSLVGALLYTFTDSFWFSAVEAEVYAFSSLCTALVFWLMFKWEERSEQPRSDRWLILIAYFMGISIGVHLLNLLCIPAMALLYYYRRYKTPNIKGALITLIISFGIIIVMMYGIIQGVPKVGGVFDVFFVNNLGMSFNSGLYIYLVLLSAILGGTLYLTDRASKGLKHNDKLMRAGILGGVMLMGIPFFGNGTAIGIILSAALAIFLFTRKRLPIKLLHTLQLSLVVVLIGFSSYGVILVRAIANPPMNENNPRNALTLRKYLAREQYGSTPLFYGPTFASRPIAVEKNGEVIGEAPRDSINNKDRYIKYYDRNKYIYPGNAQMLFPRIYSPQASHIQVYNSWMGRAYNDYTMPTFGDNLRFFLTYQVNFMYWRYFLWNFTGRQNDIQADGGLLRGNAMTGIRFIDNLFLGDTSNMPKMTTENKGHNVYYMLPLLLGLLGIAFQLLKGKEKGAQSFWITFFLFFMTGLAIVLYVNQTPLQPRERDYSYAGSFYAFCIWIGMGVTGLWVILKKLKMKDTGAAILASALALIVPVQMASQNWDDHDRSGRTIARDIGNNYLESSEPDGIIFCFGDNDTFPLWYMQDVEEVRRDIRTVNLSYLGGGWYCNQMQRNNYDAPALKMEYLTPHFLAHNEMVGIEAVKPMMGLAEGLHFATTNEAKTLPTDVLVALVNKEKLLKQVPEHLHENILENLPISERNKRYLGLDGLGVLDIIHGNDWERPIYWTVGSPRDAFSNLANFHVQTGMLWKFLPVNLLNSDSTSIAPIDLDRTYDLVMNKFRWGGAENPKVYMDMTCRNLMMTYRTNVFVPLAKGLLQRGETEKAREVLKKCLVSVRHEVVPHDEFSIYLMEVLYDAGLKKEADEVAQHIASSVMSKLDWMFGMITTKTDIFFKLMEAGEVDYEMRNAIGLIQICNKKNSQIVNNLVPRIDTYRQLIETSSEKNKEQNNPL